VQRDVYARGPGRRRPRNRRAGHSTPSPTPWLLLLVAALLLLAPVSAQDDLPTLSISVLPVLNTLPVYVAQEEGFYAEQGVNVEIVPMVSARDRQVALQAGEVDGANTDLAGVILLVNGGVDVRAVRLEPILEPYFSIVAGADSGIETIDDLRGVPIGISQNSIIEPLSTELLTEAGSPEDELVYEEVPQIPVRLELLNTGQLAAAMLPEPLTTLATQLQGATLIASDAQSEFVPTVFAFRGDVLDENGEAVTAFLAAYERAVTAINTDPEAYRDVMNANINIPEPLQATYPIPTFPTSRVPTPEQAQLVLDWMVGDDLIDEGIAYEQIIDPSFLPEPLVGTVVDIAAETEGFSTLVAAVQAAGLVDALSGAGPFTVFAPTDDAFAAALEALGLTAEELLADTETLTDILTYHVVPGNVVAGTVVTLDGQSAPTLLEGATIDISVGEGGVTLNEGIDVVQTDIIANNGVIHVIDGVLLPPEG